MSLKEEVAKLESRLRDAKRAVEVAHQDSDAETLTVLEWCEGEKRRATREVTDTVGALAKTYSAMTKNLERACESRIKSAKDAFAEDARRVQEEKSRVMHDAEAGLKKQYAEIELATAGKLDKAKELAKTLLAPLVSEVARMQARLAEKTNKPPVGADPVGPPVDPSTAETPVDGTPTPGPAGST
jgi:acyl-CoA reductase-like NAD-dependent aldehyde dehydrogenase